ncbi:MAG: response regulator [Thermodesulfobacteriota bacterium]|nr:response regulator [Thermodesulfobacteriota bacterium]
MLASEKKRILIADTKLLSLATLIGTLKDNYHVVTAKSGAEIFKRLKKSAIDMILLDTKFPDLDGFEICRQLKADQQTREIPIIFITVQNSVLDEEKGFNVGAADYIASPYNAPIVLARIKTQLHLCHAIAELKRMNQLALDANPNTGLPGNTSIIKALQQAVTAKTATCVIYADLDHFKSYNDSYGFAKGDDVIIFTANVIRASLQMNNCAESFFGHIGGDDFVIIVPTDKYLAVAEEIIRRIDRGILEFYSPEDANHGYMVATNRNGEIVQHPLVSLSMGGVDLSQRHLTTAFEVVDICTEMKKTAKEQPGSNILLCNRH